MISPRLFEERMRKHWEEELGNVYSENLGRTWQQLCYYMNNRIANHRVGKWSVLSPPTGSGKTESIVLYCSMLSELPEVDHPGALIVTRLIKDADLIAERINHYGRHQTAVAYHSDSSLVLNELHNHPVLVVTHRAFEQALDRVATGDARQTFHYFHDYRLSQERKLVCIDEALTVVDHSKVSLDSLREALGHIRQPVRDKHPSEIKAIKGVIEILETIHEKNTSNRQEVMLLTKPIDLDKYGLSGGDYPDLSGLVATIKGLSIKGDGRKAERVREFRESTIKVLKGLHYLFRSWSYYSKAGGDHCMNTARLIVPDNVGVVVFDATADCNKVYDLLDTAQRVKPPENVRSYQNFTLNVSWGHRVGKGFMGENRKELVEDFMSEMAPVLNGRKTLVVTHKEVEPILQKHATDDMSLAHWGAVDGSNQWRDCEAVVLFGLPYMPDTWSANVFMALQHPTSTEWLNDPSERAWGDYQDIRKALEIGQLVTDMVQAINRIRVRKVVDSEGNCPEAEGYLLLPRGQDGVDILNGITKAMPGVVIKEWSYRNQQRKRKGNKYKEAILKYLQNTDDTELRVSSVAKTIGIPTRTVDRLIADFRATEADTLASVGFTIHQERQGKSTANFFKKTGVTPV